MRELRAEVRSSRCCDLLLLPLQLKFSPVFLAMCSVPDYFTRARCNRFDAFCTSYAELKNLKDSRLTARIPAEDVMAVLRRHACCHACRRACRGRSSPRPPATGELDMVTQDDTDAAKVAIRYFCRKGESNSEWGTGTGYASADGR